MRKKQVLRLVVLSIGLLMAACAPGETTQDAMMDQKPTEVMMEETATPEMMEEKTADMEADDMMEETIQSDGMDSEPTEAMMDAESTDAMMEKTPDPMMETAIPLTGMTDEKEAMMAPAWFATQMTDEVTGETFRIEDFKGKVVLVETFAQWCPTCLQQQNEIVKLHEMLEMRDDLVIVSLDVDPNEDAEMLKKYLDKHGFDWHYAIAPTETAREIGSLYGASFLNPPSAPMMIIDRHGEAHPLPFGVKSAEDLQEALKPFISDGM